VPTPFTHLHVHSDASLLDGLGTVDRLVKAAASRGFEHLALTDHGTLANAVAFVQACEEYEVKPILGVEGYINYLDKIGHITLLVDGNDGFVNLVKLQNKAHAAGMGKRRPSFTLEMLAEHNDGLVCLTGCVSSPLHTLDMPEAKKYVAQLKSIFGPRVFSEIMFVADTDTWSRPLKFAKQFDLRPVITNDVHFPYQMDHEVHPILTSVKAGMTYNSKELWLKSGQQLLNRAKNYFDEHDAQAAIYRAYRIGRKLKPVVLKREPSLPHIPNANAQLRALAADGMLKYHGRHDEGSKERLEYELDTIQTMGYSTYFLILHDVIAWARTNNIRVGPGRGSGAGSLLLYLLGVTDVDPLEYGLSFERFLHKQRKGYPDVDIDFDMDGRRRVIDYAHSKWGASPIAIYSTYSHASLVHDLAKTLKMSKKDENEAADKGEKSNAFRRLAETDPLFGKSYETMRDQIRHRSKHAGGVVITDQIVPVEKAGETLVAAWTDGKYRQLSYAGIIKFDFLGLTALSALKRMEDETGESAAAPGKCEDTLRAFQEGDLAGIFQFTASSGIADLTVRVKPSSFDDLVAITALYRPGALDAGTADRYPDWKEDPREFHPLIDDILESTYGAIVYQEQVMDIFARITDGSLAEADLARRAIIKSKVGDPEWERLVASTKQTFVTGARKRGLTPKQAKRIWKELFTHVRYSFNRAHAVSYTLISWDMMWWKVHHTPLFFATMMDLDPYEFQKYLFDAADHDIEVEAPHVNVSSTRFEHDGNIVYLPFTQIKHLGAPGAQAIVTAREADGEFKTYEQFAARVERRRCTSRARLGLYEVGGFAGIRGNPLDAGIDTTKETMKTPLYELQQRYLGAVLPSADVIKKISKWDKKEKWMAGIVHDKRKKTSIKFGPYVVYRLVPDGVFWIRDGEDLENGQIVAVKANQKTGRALQVRSL
jgi:DNA polymerase-3 subunit alpha